MSNVSGVRKGTGGGPTVVFAAHMDTVFPEGTDLKVKREGDILRAPGIGDDTSNLMATLEMFRALNRGGVKTKGDLIFLASVQEELGLLGAKHWLETSGYKPDMFVAVDVRPTRSGTARCASTSSSSSTPRRARTRSKAAARPVPPKRSRRPSPRSTRFRCRPSPRASAAFKLPTINVGMLGGGTVVNAIPREAWFTVDLRSLDSATQDRLESAVVSTARRVGEQEGVGFRMERKMGIDYSKARPQRSGSTIPLVQTALATGNHFRKTGHAGDRARRCRARPMPISPSAWAFPRSPSAP